MTEVKKETIPEKAASAAKESVKTTKGILAKATVVGVIALIGGLALIGTGVYQYVVNKETALIMLFAGSILGYLFPKQNK